MSESHYFYEGFISAIKSKIPHKATLTNTITDLLAIDKDAVYRRLRGDVNFSFIEMATIAKKLGISIDGIVEIESGQSRPTQIVLTKHVNPSPLDYKMFNDYVNLYKFIKDEPNTLYMETGNTLSYSFFYDYENITRLYVCCWNQASSYGHPLPYHEVVIPDQMRSLHKDCCTYIRHIKSSHYVWDLFLFQRIVENIKFLSRIRLIKEEDVALLKNELMELLNNVENLAVKGKHEDTGNEVFIYISDVYIDANYTCIKSKNLHISLLKTFLLNATSSLDEEVYKEVSSWIYSLQRMSTLISVSGEKIRAAYFNTQRNYIDTL